MKRPHHLAAWPLSLSLLMVSGCASSPGQDAMLDDASITTAIQQRFMQHQQVDTSTIRVETQQGAVTLSGSARNFTERTAAERLTWKVRGVTGVKNDITVRH